MMDIEIVYRDEYLVVVNKPPGWLVHRSWLDPHEQVVLMQTVRDQIGQHVYTVHRLDRPTSGVIVMALSASVAKALALQFEVGSPQKIYHAVVRGYLENEGCIDYPLVEQLDPIADKFANPDQTAKTAISYYKGLATCELDVPIGRYPSARFSLVELIPKTGRKHQLRRHLSHLRHPIIGDTTHGDLKQNRGFEHYVGVKRLLLHAYKITFTHPITGKLCMCEASHDQAWLDAMRALGWARFFV